MKSKKRTTIFRQLMLSVMLPVVLVIAVLSWLNFAEKKEQINANRKATIKLIQSEIGEFLAFFDMTLFEIEKDMAKRGEYFSEILSQETFASTEFIETINMDSVRDAVGMTATEDIYIIDTNGVVVNTTYEKDLGLNFYSITDYFIGHFKAIRERKEFIADRISIEMTTNLPKKYMYRTTNDSKYIIEFGFYSDPAKTLVHHFIEKLDSMPKKYEGIDTVSLYFGTSGFSSYQKHIIPPADTTIALKTLNTGEETQSQIEKNGLIYTSEYSKINMESSLLHKGYVIRIIHNDKLVRDLVRKELLRFLINLAIFVIPIFALILWRARVLSRPISNLAAKMSVIQQGNLDERVAVTGNNEVTVLSEQFNSMIDQLQESYATLEQKVEDRTRELREQKDIVEEAHKEITDSIKYAKRLQDAILPPLNLFNELLPESFVLFQPKDVVSGDFYWLEKREDFVFVAAADCTGHGVPGAMVSVVCSNALHRTVNEFGIMNPAEILNSTRKLIIETFAKSDREVKDGMDISLCRIDLKNKKMIFAGANNPLWLIRDKKYLSQIQLKSDSILMNDDAALLEFKANKQPVGLYAGMKYFTQEEIDLMKGDTIYLFTDGYADQFGGDSGKKMKYKPFKENLLNIQSKNLVDQHEKIATDFKNWKGKFEQIDDVCVLGIRI
jgi:sigma-B regulation protein RsbU (phosphoserine phosphatase)